MIQHNNIVNQIYGLQKSYSFEPGFHHILLAPFTFDPSVQQIFLPLISGGKLHLVPKAVKEDPEELLSYIAARQMDIVNTVPSLMDLLLNHAVDHRGLYFKYIILAGELFSTALHRKLRDSISVDKLINIYGPTEATINTTWYECKAEETIIPIGKPLLNYKIAILDKYFNLLPIGLVGEIGIMGKGLSRGYLNQPQLTRERFVESPWFPAERMYMTGDFGRWMPDGNIQFLGRIDLQVKVRGIRIELEEIENQLLTHSEIKKAVVVAKEYKEGGNDLCAYYVVETNSTPAVGELRKFLKKKLPDYMIPSYFMQLEEIPLTNNGKVDMKALPGIGRGQMDLETEYTPPASEIEKTIANIWKDVLKLDKVGIDHNFFDLGGNSLDIIKVNSRLKEVSGKGISVVAMFKYPTIRSLARNFSQPQADDTSLNKDRSEALARGERDRNIRLQMRKKTRN